MSGGKNFWNVMSGEKKISGRGERAARELCIRRKIQKGHFLLSSEVLSSCVMAWAAAAILGPGGMQPKRISRYDESSRMAE